MNRKENISEQEFRQFLRSLPEDPPGSDLNGRIMQRVRQAEQQQKKRTERNGLIWTIVLSSLLLGAGVWAICYYVDWGAFSLPAVDWKSAGVSGSESGLSSQNTGMYHGMIPLAIIFLVLLAGDTWLRRRFREKIRH